MLAISAPLHASPARVAQAPAKSAAQTPGSELDKARAQLAKSQRELSTLRADKVKLDREYQAQLADIDKLKQQRASWRRDRAIRTRMSESHGTAGKLAALDKRIRDAQESVRNQKKAMVAVIDRELARTADQTRRAQLMSWRRDAQRGLQRQAKKIVLPEDTIDPLADPEELEYQASLLRQSEDELEREMNRLADQAKHYRHMADLRQKYQRADEFGRFDNDQPRRSSGSSAARYQGTSGPASDADQPPSAPEGSPTTDDLGGALSDDPMFDVVLADVVDAPTIRALQAAEASSDPLVKAKAAERAREQVEKRMKRLEERRKIMQERARALERAP